MCPTKCQISNKIFWVFHAPLLCLALARARIKCHSHIPSIRCAYRSELNLASEHHSLRLSTSCSPHKCCFPRNTPAMYYALLYSLIENYVCNSYNYCVSVRACLTLPPDRYLCMCSYGSVYSYLYNM